MARFVEACNRCGFEEVHDGPVWEDWFVPRVCEQPAPDPAQGDGTCGGTMVRQPLPPDE